MRRKTVNEERARVYFYTTKKAKESYWDVVAVRAARADRKKKDYTLGDLMEFLEINDFSFDEEAKQRMLKGQRGESFTPRIPEGMIIWMETPDRHCTWVNPQWHEITGASWEETEGSGWANFLHPDDLKDVMGRLKQATEEGRPHATEFRLRRRDGKYVWMGGHSIPRYGPHQEIVGYEGAAMPIPGPNMMITPPVPKHGLTRAPRARKFFTRKNGKPPSSD